MVEDEDDLCSLFLRLTPPVPRLLLPLFDVDDSPLEEETEKGDRCSPIGGRKEGKEKYVREKREQMAGRVVKTVHKPMMDGV